MSIKRIFSAVLLSAIAIGAGAQQAARRPYIVQLADTPAAAYTGGVSGYSATRPAPGAKFKVNAANVQSYIGYLDRKRSTALAAVGNVRVIHKYSVALNGMSVMLTEAEARKIRGTAGVVAVTADTPRHVDTVRTPAFLGLSTPGGLWSEVDAAARAVKGEDVIIGMVDGGIWPEDLSFSDQVDAAGKPVAAGHGTLAYGPPPAKWEGSCETGPGFKASNCNNKLIGARFFKDAFDANNALLGQVISPAEFPSPRDSEGHGSHTSSTAGGNSGVPAVIDGVNFGAMSGIAPRARIATYKVCWTAEGQDNGCYNSDSVAAIEQAVVDGVDVINFSIGGTLTNFLDPVEVAFFNASAAGVFVAASAGNDGPANTVAHISPWLTTVAASTDDRFSVATVRLGNGATYTGASLSTGVPASRLILSTAAALVGPFDDSNTEAKLCFLGALDPAKVAGKIVVCDRGSNDRVEKSLEVKNRGGVGMILLNASAAANDTVGDIHSVPTVHLPLQNRAAIRGYAATAGATASIGVAGQAKDVIAPVMADFSSRGPNIAEPSILKPDISGPGVDIIAAFAYIPATQAEHDAIANGSLVPPTAVSIISGTSMASPHIAGSAALLKQLHPTWSPSAIKSALMTSTGPIKLANGSLDPDRFGYGAGHLNPTPAAATKLVYDAGPEDYLGFLCGEGLLDPAGATCKAFGFISASDLNLPSLTGDVVGISTLHRTVTNVGASNLTYVASASLPGYSVSISPASITLAPGQSKSFDVTLTRTSALPGEWIFGSLSWGDGVTGIRSPLTARALSLSAPALLSDVRAVGTKSFSIATGYAGTLTVPASGLVAATRSTGSVLRNGETCFNVAVPAGALHARFQLFDSDTTGQGRDDLDLAVYLNNALVGSSGGETADELVDIPSPAPGTYEACVDGYAPAGGKSTFTLSSWAVTPGPGVGRLKALAPSKVYLGGTGTVGVAWSAAANVRYLGVLQYKDGGGVFIGSSLLAIDNVSAVTPNQTASGRKGLKSAQR